MRINTRVFARNFRGFKAVEVDLSRINFVIGDNSSGKSSLLHLIEAVLRTGLTSTPRLEEDLGVSEYDYFSQYFDFDDVTFGFSQKEPDDFIQKMVTFRRMPGRPPRALRCSYITQNFAITIKVHGNSIRLRIKKGEFSYGDDYMYLHDETSGFVEVSNSLRGISIFEPHALILAISGNSRFGKELPSIMPKIFGHSIPLTSFIGPIRSLPAKYYDFSRRVSTSGLHFATMWHDFEKGKFQRDIVNVNKFGKDSKLFDSLQVRKIAKGFPDSPLLVAVEKGGREFLLNQVGVGVSQIVPVLAQILFSKSSSETIVALTQQPELHLHPIAQAALGSFIFKMSQSKFRGVLETHSSFMVDRFRADLRKSKTSKVSARIIFCENLKEGNVAHNIEIGQDGKLDGAPDAYFSFFLNELNRTMF